MLCCRRVEEIKFRLAKWILLSVCIVCFTIIKFYMSPQILIKCLKQNNVKAFII